MLGYMPVPPDFKYADVLRHGRPVHKAGDPFTVKHPPMEPGRRAKIFKPFAALKGFEEAVEAKEALYCERAELSEDECAELDRVMSELLELVKDTASARENAAAVTVMHFVPCSDRNSDAYGRLGQYVRTSGTLRGIDTVRRTVNVDGKCISFGDISAVEKCSSQETE